MLFNLYPRVGVGVSRSPESSLSTDHSVDVIAESRLPRRVEGTVRKAVNTAGGELIILDQAGCETQRLVRR